MLADDSPAVNPLRVDARARADWQEVLRTRSTQRQELTEANARAVDATEPRCRSCATPC